MKFILTGIIKIKSTKIFIKKLFLELVQKRGHFYTSFFCFLLFSKNLIIFYFKEGKIKNL
ncbi:hypothetical protein C1143_09015 [Clostridium botulinum]|nr:hypothetical protein C1143_09015 [Clostridium botulinum]